jgi:transcriptional antiterminator Rof (Rho-off)
MDPAPPKYAPIACDLYDQLILITERRRPVEMRRDGAAEQVVIVDISTREGAEWATLADGRVVRLDLAVWAVSEDRMNARFV